MIHTIATQAHGIEYSEDYERIIELAQYYESCGMVRSSQLPAGVGEEEFAVVGFDTMKDLEDSGYHYEEIV